MVIEVKNALDGLTSRLDTIQERIKELEDTSRNLRIHQKKVPKLKSKEKKDWGKNGTE